LHGADVNLAIRSQGIERFCWRFLLRSSDAITTCSNWLASAAVGFDPSLATKVQVVYNAADEADRNEVSAPSMELPRISETQRILLNIGTFEHKKGQDVLIEALKLLLLKGKDVRLVLVGAAGPTLDDIRRKIESEELESRVTLHLDVLHRDVWAFLSAATVFVLSSRIEPFGIVILEAGLSKLPVVASAVGGVPEIISDGINGRLVPPDDPKALATAICQVLDNPTESDRMAQQLRADVINRFNWERCYVGFLRAAGLDSAPTP
jgi:glycosyltransferase involved in cell wall biosynthesis